MFPKEFCFTGSKTTNKNTETIAITKDILYCEETGYGFVTEANRAQNEELKIPELNTGFDVPHWYRGFHITSLKQDENGCYIDTVAAAEQYDFSEERLLPICFKTDVERDGNYEVKLRLFGCGEVLVFAGPRRLVYHNTLGNQEKNEPKEAECCFIVNVCDIIPRGRVNLSERRSLDIAVLGKNVHLMSISYHQTGCPTIYIAGDSTVTDQSAEYPYAPETSYCGWGQMLSAYTTNRVAVSNHAHSGLTTESFRSEGHYAIVQSSIKPGDYFFIQFAHNDQKLSHLMAEGGYRERVCTYIEEIRRQGAYPIIVTPLARNTWKATEGVYNDLLGEYAKVCKKIGQEYHVPVVDLHQRSMEEIMRLGVTCARKYFYPKDYTHTNDYGAYLMAGYVAEELQKILPAYSQSGYQRLLEVLCRPFGSWQAKDGVPVAPEAPLGYAEQKGSDMEHTAGTELERPEDPLTRVEALDFIIKATRLFPTNVFNDEFHDVVGHEWYAGTVECAYQNGIIPEWMVPNQKLEPDKTVTLEEFICLMMNGYSCRKPYREDQSCALETVCDSRCISQIRGASALGLISQQSDLKKRITRQEAKALCLAMDV